MKRLKDFNKKVLIISIGQFFHAFVDKGTQGFVNRWIDFWRFIGSQHLTRAFARASAALNTAFRLPLLKCCIIGHL